MSLKNKAKETLAILQARQYISALEKVVNFTSEQQAAEKNTKLYNPEELKRYLKLEEIEITNNTSTKRNYKSKN